MVKRYLIVFAGLLLALTTTTVLATINGVPMPVPVLPTTRVPFSDGAKLTSSSSFIFDSATPHLDLTNNTNATPVSMLRLDSLGRADGQAMIDWYYAAQTNRAAAISFWREGSGGTGTVTIDAAANIFSAAAAPGFMVTGSPNAEAGPMGWATASANHVCYTDVTLAGGTAHMLATCTSSRRFKEDIQPLQYRSNDLWKLEPMRFKYKADGRVGIGLIAEEVAPIIPDLVGREKDGTPATVDYDGLTVMLLAEMKSMQERIRILEDRCLVNAASVK